MIVGAAPVDPAHGRKAVLGQLLARAVVEALVVVVEAGGRQGGVLEDVPALPALVEVELPRLVLVEIGGVQPAGEVPGPAPRAGRPGVLEPLGERGRRRDLPRRHRPGGPVVPPAGGRGAGDVHRRPAGSGSRWPRPGRGAPGRPTRAGGRGRSPAGRSRSRPRPGPAPAPGRGRRPGPPGGPPGRRAAAEREVVERAGEGRQPRELAPAVDGALQAGPQVGGDPQGAGCGGVALGPRGESGQVAPVGRAGQEADRHGRPPPGGAPPPPGRLPASAAGRPPPGRGPGGAAAATPARPAGPLARGRRPGVHRRPSPGPPRPGWPGPRARHGPPPRRDRARRRRSPSTAPAG